MGDYLDAHPDTNQMMTTMLQQQAGPQSMTSLKAYFEAHPKVATDLQTISQPLTGLSTQCKLSISLPQALGLVQQAGGAGGLPGGAGAAPSGGAGAGPSGGAGTSPLGGPQGVPHSPVPGTPGMKSAG
jgi:hemophore-related protein